MSEESSNKPPLLFYWISGIALAWNVIGIFAYLSQVTMSDEAIANMSLAEQALYNDIPAWAISAYAIAVTAGALGCLLLLLRKAWALPVLVISLAAVLVQFSHAFFMTDALAVRGATSVIVPIAIILIGSFLVWYANDVKKNGWIS